MIQSRSEPLNNCNTTNGHPIPKSLSENNGPSKISKNDGYVATRPSFLSFPTEKRTMFNENQDNLQLPLTVLSSDAFVDNLFERYVELRKLIALHLQKLSTLCSQEAKITGKLPTDCLPDCDAGHVSLNGQSVEDSPVKQKQTAADSVRNKRISDNKDLKFEQTWASKVDPEETWFLSRTPVKRNINLQAHSTTKKSNDAWNASPTFPGIGVPSATTTRKVENVQKASVIFNSNGVWRNDQNVYQQQTCCNRCRNKMNLEQSDEIQTISVGSGKRQQSEPRAGLRTIEHERSTRRNQRCRIHGYEFGDEFSPTRQRLTKCNTLGVCKIFGQYRNEQQYLHSPRKAQTLTNNQSSTRTGNIRMVLNPQEENYPSHSQNFHYKSLLATGNQSRVSSRRITTLDGEKIDQWFIDRY